MKLSTVALTTSNIEVPYGAFPSFKVKVGYIGRELQRKIFKSSTVAVYDEQMQVTTDEMNTELFAENYAKAAILGWSGLTPEILSQLILVDEEALKEQLGEATEVPHNVDNAVYLMRNCVAFDRWVTDQAGKLSNFRK